MSHSNLNIVINQLNFLVGDIEGNGNKIINNIRQAKSQFNADCVVFTELSMIGYPPEDLLHRSNVTRRIKSVLTKIKSEVTDVCVILGLPWIEDKKQFNAAIIIQNGNIIEKYYKMALPNYSVFDEKRYFVAGKSPCVDRCKRCLCWSNNL